jgi:integrase
VLTIEQVRDLRAKLTTDQRALDVDLVDFVDMMLATGLRIGETAAITWASIDDQAGTLEVRATVIRVKGKGLMIQPKPKSKAGWRVIELPTWAVAMLRRRHGEMEPNEWGAVFPSPAGRLRDPSNTQGHLKDAFERLGFEGVTSHAFRRTVATLMDRAALSPRAAADQLGHANVSMTTDVYFGRRLAATGAAAVLEAMNEPGRPNEKDGKGWIRACWDDRNGP